MKAINKLWHKLIDILLLSVKRFPEALLAAYVVTVLAIMTNHQNYNGSDTIERLLMSASLAIPLFGAAILFYERSKISLKIRIAADLVLLLFPILYYILMPEVLSNWFGARFVAIQVMLYALFIAMPYLYKREMVGTHLVKFMTSFFITYLYTFVLFGGFAAIIFTVDQLFDLNIDGEIYADLFFVAVGFFGVTYFLGRLEQIETQLTLEDYSKIIRVLIVSIVMPISAAYTLVLYAYFIKILIQMEWPQGLVGQLVVWYGFISTAVLFVINDLSHNAWVRIYKRFYPMALLIPIGMLFTAIFIRINAYGLTMARFFVVAAGLWILSAATYYIFRQDKSQSAFVICSFILITGLSIVGPWNAYHLSTNNQVNRLMNFFEEGGLLQNGRIVANEEASQDLQGEITSILYYLEGMDALDQVAVLPEEFTTNDMEVVLGFGYQGYWEESGSQYFGYYNQPKLSIQKMEDYDYVVQLSSYSETNKVTLEDINFSLDLESDKIVVEKAGSVLIEQPISEMAAQFYELYGTNNEKEVGEYTYTAENNRIKVTFNITEMYGNRVNDMDMDVDGMSGWAFVKIK